MRNVSNKVQLITYPDGLGGDLRALAHVLDVEFGGLFAGGIHLLPPFPSTADRGFAPVTHDDIDPRFGTWEDVRRVGERADLMLDLIVNHISSRSAQFQDFVSQGRASPWADLFITLDKVWPDGEPVPADLDRIFLRRRRPWSTFPIGRPPVPTRVWTTFGKTDPAEQIDMDWRSSQYRSVVEEYFIRFAANGVKMVRLDAVGYLAKRAGTTCFFVQPETDQILAWFDDLAAHYDLALLPEVHARPDIQRMLVRRGTWMYDFILPYRILEALILRTPIRLAAYLADRPEHVFTVLDCHDGIPIKPDLDGLYEGPAARDVVDTCLARGGNLSLVVAREHQDADGFDVHQIRGTIYSLLGCDDDAYVTARAIQVFAPGVPQIYYVGLLAGENDAAAAERSGDGREINRHSYTLDEIRAGRRRAVVQRLERLLRLRNSHPAFDGAFETDMTDDGHIRMAWTADDQAISLEVDVFTPSCFVMLTNGHGARRRFAP